MRTTFAILSVLLLSAGLAHAQPAEPVNPPPVFKVVASADKVKGEIVFLEKVYRIMNGQTVAEEYKTEITIADCRVITPSGKQVPNDDLWKRLKNGTVVVVSTDGKTPAEPILRALNAEMLVIIPAAPKNVPLVPQPKQEGQGDTLPNGTKEGDSGSLAGGHTPKKEGDSGSLAGGHTPKKEAADVFCSPDGQRIPTKPGAADVFSSPDGQRIPSKNNPVVVIKLRIPAEAKYADVEKLLDKVKAQEGTKLYLGVSKAGESFSAEVVAESLTPSKRVAAVVKELLDGGITKVSVQRLGGPDNPPPMPGGDNKPGRNRGKPGAP
jgi:hypothetical protein